MATEIRVRCAQAKKMLSKPNRKIKEIKSLIQKRYNFNDETNKLELSIKPLAYDPACYAAANCENLKFKLLAGTPVRNAANNVMGTVMRQGKAIVAKSSFAVRSVDSVPRPRSTPWDTRSPLDSPRTISLTRPSVTLSSVKV